ncbi:MAG: hypothetical protein RR075_07015 [Pygmaiobacter sp.]
MDKKMKTERQRQEDAALNKMLIWIGCAVLAEVVLLLLGRFGLGPAAAVQLLSYLVPIVAILAVIYYLYRYEFFVVALVSALGMLGLWGLFREGISTGICVALAVLAAALAALAVFLRVLQKRGGKLMIKGKLRELLPKNANYAVLYATCGLTVAVLALALVFSGAAAISTAIFYAAPVAWLLIMAVYYTVKLM